MRTHPSHSLSHLSRSDSRFLMSFLASADSWVGIDTEWTDDSLPAWTEPPHLHSLDGSLLSGEHTRRNEKDRTRLATIQLAVPQPALSERGGVVGGCAFVLEALEVPSETSGSGRIAEGSPSPTASAMRYERLLVELLRWLFSVETDVIQGGGVFTAQPPPLVGFAFGGDAPLIAHRMNSAADAYHHLVHRDDVRRRVLDLQPLAVSCGLSTKQRVRRHSCAPRHNSV